ncbi:hypothetical protein BX661DRAFT_198964 [Kickxella alabastrina]|uniref:uncharacterized protein n=1 Tax=Kickxella alabastrina TaxID=61397 RepID=UPI00221F8ACC|nr:uncharacterized protein BX661DRAFT_198964 [Kickxella alabastrina]KAI7826372.1 hypothetical protein BX661DRAFT_198964 [Kickxella alabastrina]
MASDTNATVPPRPLRTISDEFRELQYIIDQFQSQLDTPEGTASLHPFGPINAEKAQSSFSQACFRLRESLTGYRDMTLAPWAKLLSIDAAQLQQQQQQHQMNGGIPVSTPVMAATHRAAAAAQELVEMRKITDALHEDTSKCKGILFDAAGSAISKALSMSSMGQPGLLVERLKATAKKLELAHYIDVQKREGEGEVTTVTLAGGILVIDVDIGTSKEQLKVKVSYVSDIEHDKRIDALMLSRLLSTTFADSSSSLTKERAPANFIHNTFAISATLAEIQQQELRALGGDVRGLLRQGSGIALPHTRHVGPSTLFFAPAAIKSGLSQENWAALQTNSLCGVAGIPGLRWLCFNWEPAKSPHCFMPAQFQQYCLQSDHMVEDSESHRVVTVSHPSIHGLQMRFLEFTQHKSAERSASDSDDSMQVDGQDEQDKNNRDELWIPYALVARLESPLPACALTVRRIMDAIAPGATIAGPGHDGLEETDGGTLQGAPRLLEDAATLEHLMYAKCTAGKSSAEAAATDLRKPTFHCIARRGISVEVESPQICAWNICRVPLSHPRNVLAVVPLLRRQAVFNELLASCFNVINTGTSDVADTSNEPVFNASKVTAKTHANDPFRLDILVKEVAPEDDSDENGKRAKMGGDQQNMDTGAGAAANSRAGTGQGVVLRVVESTGDIFAWTHQSLGLAKELDLLAAMNGIASTTLTKANSHASLSASGCGGDASSSLSGFFCGILQIAHLKLTAVHHSGKLIVRVLTAVIIARLVILNIRFKVDAEGKNHETDLISSQMDLIWAKLQGIKLGATMTSGHTAYMPIIHTRDPGYFHKDQFLRTEHTTSSAYATINEALEVTYPSLLTASSGLCALCTRADYPKTTLLAVVFVFCTVAPPLVGNFADRDGGIGVLFTVANRVLTSHAGPILLFCVQRQFDLQSDQLRVQLCKLVVACVYLGAFHLSVKSFHPVASRTDLVNGIYSQINVIIYPLAPGVDMGISCFKDPAQGLRSDATPQGRDKLSVSLSATGRLVIKVLISVMLNDDRAGGTIRSTGQKIKRLRRDAEAKRGLLKTLCISRNVIRLSTKTEIMSIQERYTCEQANQGGLATVNTVHNNKSARYQEVLVINLECKQNPKGCRQCCRVAKVQARFSKVQVRVNTCPHAMAILEVVLRLSTLPGNASATIASTAPIAAGIHDIYAKNHIREEAMRFSSHVLVKVSDKLRSLRPKDSAYAVVMCAHNLLAPYMVTETEAAL